MWVESGDWASAKAELTPYLLLLGGLYLLSITSMTVQTQLMAVMTQGFLDKLRRELFDGMQNLPIRYFDTHKFGDIMSHYTNDTDTLRQMLSQTIPQTFSASITIIVVFVLMLSISVWLTLVVLCFVAIMLFCAGKVGGNSAKYYVARQQSLGRVNAHVEEFINGQKVVKVFNHEEKVKEQFDEKNEELRRVTVYLPRPKILNVDIDPKSFQLYSEKEGLWNRITVTDFNDSLIELEANAEAKALEKGVLEHAGANARQLIENLVGTLIDTTEYSILFLYG